jgi:hypothetical protein
LSETHLSLAVAHAFRISGTNHDGSRFYLRLRFLL